MSAVAQLTTGTVPGALPLVGHTIQLLRSPLAFLESLPVHGDLTRIRVGTQPYYVACHPEVFRHVLRNPDIYDKGGPFFDRLRAVVGNGLVTSPWEDHRHQRPRLQPAFHRDKLADYAEAMVDEICSLNGEWRDGEVIDVKKFLVTFTTRSLIRALFALPADHFALERLDPALQVLGEAVYWQMLTPRALRRLPTRANRQYQRAGAYLRTLAESVLQESRSGAAAEHGLLSGLLRPQGQPPSSEEIFNQAVTFVGAATAPTGSVLAWAFHLLAKDGAVEERLHAEVDQVLGDRLPTHQDLARLPYTRAVIEEVLRLYPPGWLFTRITTRPDTIAGQHLPTGSVLLLSPYLLHRNPALFPDPARFEPARWLRENAGEVPRGAMLPFGTGPRKCIGDQYAMVESTLALSTIAARWRLRHHQRTDIRPQAKALLAPGPLRMQLVRRDRGRS